MSKKLLLFPFGGNSREALDAIESINRAEKKWDVLGFIDDNPSLHGQEFCGIKILGGKEVLKEFPEVQVLAIPGNPDTYLQRQTFIENLKLDKSCFATIIHPSAVVASEAQIGYNTLLMPNVVVSSGASIGNHCIILPNTTVSHDSVIGDYGCVGSNVSISGYVTIESNCYIGSGTRIRNNITIHEKSLIGLGSNVVSDIEREVVVAGNPAKKIHGASL